MAEKEGESTSASSSSHQLRWDPEILSRQNAWTTLFDEIDEMEAINPRLHTVDPTFSVEGQISDITLWMSEYDQAMLGRIYFRSALQGECLFYPQNSDQLKWYYLRKASFFRNFVDVIILLLLSVPIIVNQECLSYRVAKPSQYASDLLLLFGAAVQLFDAYLYFHTTNWANSRTKVKSSLVMDYSHRWEYLRVLACLALIINAVVALGDVLAPKITMALTPILLIVRRDDFKQLLEGVFHSMRKIVKFAKLWILFLFVWAFTGFCLFRRYTASPEQDELKYSNYYEALYTTMHCMLSRPTVLYRLKPIFQDNNYSAFYFVFLTTVGDILLMTVIIAMGTRQFRDFSKEVFHARSKYRRMALHALFTLYSIDHNYPDEGKDGSPRKMNVHGWVALCRHLGPYYKLHEVNNAIALFSTEDKGGTGFVDERGFFRLAAALSTRLLLFTRGFILPYQQRVVARKKMLLQSSSSTTGTANAVTAPTTTTTTEEQVKGGTTSTAPALPPPLPRTTISAITLSSYENMERFSSSTRAVTEIYQRSLSTAETGNRPRSSSSSSASSSVSMSRTSSSKSVTSLNNEAMLKSRGSTVYNLFIRPEATVAKFQNHYEKTIDDIWKNPELQAYYQTFCEFCVDILHYEMAILVPAYIHNNRYAVLAVKWVAQIKRGSTVIGTSSNLHVVTPMILGNARAMSLMTERTDSNTGMGSAAFPAAGSTGLGDENGQQDVYYAVIDVFQQLRRLLMLLLLVQVSLLCQNRPTIGAIVFSWIMLFFFCLEAIILSIASQAPKMETRTLILLNMMSFVTLCAVGGNANSMSPTALTLYILTQSLRLAKFLFNADSMRIFHAILPVLLRVTILYLLVIYAYAVVGNLTLCHVIDADTISEHDYDDDSNGWVNFSQLLNFNTFFAAFYTMASSAILSNWSMILDAAIRSTNKSTNIWIYIYFYSFRVFVVILVLPLMMSCIIQTFIQQLKKKKEEEDEEEEPEEVVGDAEEAASEGSVRGSGATGSGSGSSRRQRKHRDRKKMGLEYYHITGKDIGNDTILSLWLPNGSKASVTRPLSTAISAQNNISPLLPLPLRPLSSSDRPLSNRSNTDGRQLNTITFQRGFVLDRESIAMVPAVARSIERPLPVVSTNTMMHNNNSVNNSNSSSSSYKPPIRLQEVIMGKELIFRVIPASMIYEQNQFVTNLLQHHQRYNGWQSLPTIDYTMLPYCQQRLNMKDKYELAYLWLVDSVEGERLSYPTTRKELVSLRILKDQLFIRFYYIITISQILAIFLIVPRCDLTSSPQGAGQSVLPRLALNIFNLICSLFYLVEAGLHIYAIESPELVIVQRYVRAASTASSSSTSPPPSNDQTKGNVTATTTKGNGVSGKGGGGSTNTISGVIFQSWTGLRILIAICIFFKSLLPIVSPNSEANNFRLLRCLYPVMLITRNQNHVDILKAIALSFRESKAVYKLLLALLFLFSMVGYWLFHRLSTEADRFGNILISFLTVLHCATAAPFSLYVLTPYYTDYSMVTPIFFVLLSYAIEILCINLIVAAGSVHFNNYGEQVLKDRMTRRYDALLGVWMLLHDIPSDDEKDYEEDNNNNNKVDRQTQLVCGRSSRMSLSQWVKFTQSLSERYYISEETAVLFFLYVSRQDYRQVIPHVTTTTTTTGAVEGDDDGSKNEMINNPLQSSHMRERKSMMIIDHHHHQQQEEEEEEEEEEEKECNATISSEQFLALLFFLLNGVRCRLHHSSRRNYHRPVSATSSSVINSVNNSINSNNSNSVDNPMRTVRYDTEVELITFSDSSKNNPSRSYSSTSTSNTNNNVDHVKDRLIGRGRGEVYYDLYFLKEGIRGEAKPFSSSSSSHSYQVRSPAFFSTTIDRLQSICSLLIEAQIFGGRISALVAFSLVMHFLLLIQLSFFTSMTQSTIASNNFGYFLEGIFWLEMMIYIFGLGMRRYFRDSIHLLRCVVNVGSFISMIALGATTSIHHDNSNNNNNENIYNTVKAAFLWLVLFQCLRLGLVCIRVRGHGRYRIILENSFRAFFLFFLVLYFFTIFAQTAFCGVLDSDSNVSSSSSSSSSGDDGFTDDDASSWNQFSSILNFNNYAQAIFTLFEVSVLGSWSMVMDATAKNSDSALGTMIFFFTFRFIIVLMVLPLLVSFMIRSFIALNDRVSTLHKEKRERLMRRKKANNNNNNEKERKEDKTENEAPENKEHPIPSYRVFWLNRWRQLTTCEWLTFKPQRRERRLGMHAAFLDIWDTSMRWLVSREQEGAERYARQESRQLDDHHDSQLEEEKVVVVVDDDGDESDDDEDCDSIGDEGEGQQEEEERKDNEGTIWSEDNDNDNNNKIGDDYNDTRRVTSSESEDKVVREEEQEVDKLEEDEEDPMP